MFKREHHIRIATILQALDPHKLSEQGCLFGGGTAITLTYGEYRESVDIDFLVSDPEGYRDLRQMIKQKNDLSPIIREGLHLNLSRDIRADQYGIRTLIDQGGVEVKFEIVHEGRISLETPTSKDQICGVSTLTRLDMAASKLLANSDRWGDDAVFSRDIIDLAMLKLTKKELSQAIEKSKVAYGESIVVDLKKAIQGLKNRPGRLSHCMSMLKINAIPEAVVWENIRKLEPA